MPNHPDRLPILRSYFLISAASGIIACLLLLRACWQAVTGLSSAVTGMWLGLLSTVIVFSIIFTILAVIVFRTPNSHVQQVSIRMFFDRSGTRVALIIAGLLMYAVGAIYLFSASPEIYGPTYPERLLPFFLWLASLGLLTALHMALYQSVDSTNNTFRLIILLVILTTGILVNLHFWSYESPRQEDIYFIYLDGVRDRKSVV